MLGTARRPPTCRGFTLLEVLIVLAILVTLAAMSWPALQRPLAQSRLRGAAKQLRLELAGARLKALQSGTVYQLRYQPGSRRFEVATFSGSDYSVGAGRLEPDDPRAEDQEPAIGLLPRGIVFFDPEAPDDPPQAPDIAESEREDSWSDRIAFYPDGRTSNARIRLFGRYDYVADVTLRGLTGVARVERLKRLEKQP
jgi:prepilin-type N-terminal cleavage/methylation domain-containing protein